MIYLFSVTTGTFSGNYYTNNENYYHSLKSHIMHIGFPGNGRLSEYTVNDIDLDSVEILCMKFKKIRTINELKMALDNEVMFKIIENLNI